MKCIADLIDFDKRWNVELLNTLYDNEIVEAVKKIDLPGFDIEDKLL